ncbi:MAG: ribulose-phosphate 3-epimerase [Candidatus Altiarchaeota archaeon]
MNEKIIPAVIAKTQGELDDILARVLPVADTLQLDIMNGLFVPNHSLDFDFSLPETDAHFEAHLMVDEPFRWITENITKVNTVLAPIETCKNPEETIDLVKENNRRMGFVLNPETPLTMITPYLESLDQVLIMTVNPGAYGAPFLPEVLPKISELRRMRPDVDIEVDGGITPDTIGRVFEAGANMFVSGSYIVKSDDPGDAVNTLKNLVSRE